MLRCMSIPLPRTASATLVARRARCAAALGTTSAVIFSGHPRPRNYPANIYPYRGDSSFLYFVGCGIPGAALLISAAGAELFVPALADDDALWHGDAPTLDQLSSATGVTAVHEFARLAPRLAELKQSGGELGSIPCVEASMRRHQIRLLGRSADATGEHWPLEDVEADVRVAQAIVDTRLVHDAAAISGLERAAEGTAAGHRAGIAATKPGRTEAQIRAAIEHEFFARDMDTAYASIVTVHGEVLHAHGYGNTLAAGDLLLADAGADYDGWAGDVTRTWPVSGSFSSTQRDLYDVVLAGQERGIAMVRPGARYRDIHLASCLVLAQGLVDLGILRGDPQSLVEAGTHAAFFPHGLGHLIGLDVHDMEDFGDRAGYAAGRSRSPQFGLGYLRLDRDLQPGMMVTIEPGFYQVPAILNDPKRCTDLGLDAALNRDVLARFADVRGIRIEDDVLCTEAEPRVMSATIPKAADEMCALVGSNV